MITMGEVYWITRLDDIQGILLTLIVIGCIWFFCLTVTYAGEDCWTDKECNVCNNLRSRFKKIILFLLLCSLLGTFIPDAQEAAAIYLIPKMANNKQIQRIPDNAAKFLNLEFQKYIKQMEK